MKIDMELARQDDCLDRIVPSDLRLLVGERDALRAENERLTMQLTACGVVALSNTPDSAAKARNMHPDYMSAACQDVMRAVDAEMSLRAELAALKAVPEAVEAAGFIVTDINGDFYFALDRQTPCDLPLMTVAQHNAIVAALSAPAAGQDVGALVEALERTAAAETAMRTILDFSDSEMRDGDAARDIALDFLNTRGCHE